jgi:hypothetical protein
MTLHRYIAEEQTTDELDSLIQWALHESVAGAAPSPHAWERVLQGVDRLATLGQARIRRIPDVLLQVAAACLLRVDVFLPALETPAVQRDEHVSWGDDTEWMRILDQHRQVMPLVC